MAQSLARKGPGGSANTGYGYGMDDSIAYTERVMQLLADKLTSVQGMSVGEALRWAKQRYIGGVPSGGFGTYDEKAMIEATLYGLPMYRVNSLLLTWSARDTRPSARVRCRLRRFLLRPSSSSRSPLMAATMP